MSKICWFFILLFSIGSLIRGASFFFIISLFSLIERFHEANRSRASLDDNWLVPLTEIFCGLLKWHFKEPRPGWVDKAVIIRANSHEYSFPSSHAGIAVGLATFFTMGDLDEFGNEYGHSLQYPRLLAFAVCLSRVYEGAHHVHDVIAGTAFGIAMGCGLIALQREIKIRFADLDDLTCICYGLTACVALILFIENRYKAVSKSPVPPTWNSHAKRSKSFKGSLNPHAIPYMSYVGMSGVLIGLSIGEVLCHHTPLPVVKTHSEGLARAFVGLTCLLGMFFGVRFVEKKNKPGSTLALVLRGIRYGQVPPLIVLVAPIVFGVLGL